VPYLCGFGFANVGHSSLGRGSFSFIFVLRSFSQDFPPDARRELAQPEGPTLNLAMDGVVVEVPDLGVIGSEVRQRISIYVLHSKNIVFR
jgi:hypothetical protein